MIPRPAYITSGPHLSGYTVTLGYETLSGAQQAHDALAKAGRDASQAQDGYEADAIGEVNQAPSPPEKA